MWDNIVDFSRNHSTTASAAGAGIESTLDYIGAGKTTYFDLYPKLTKIEVPNGAGRAIDTVGKGVAVVTAGMDVVVAVDALANGQYAEAGYRGVCASGAVASLWLAPGPGWAIAGGAFVVDRVKSHYEGKVRREAAEHTFRTWNEVYQRDLQSRQTGYNRAGDLKSQWNAGGCSRFE